MYIYLKFPIKTINQANSKSKTEIRMYYRKWKVSVPDCLYYFLFFFFLFSLHIFNKKSIWFPWFSIVYIIILDKIFPDLWTHKSLLSITTNEIPFPDWLMLTFSWNFLTGCGYWVYLMITNISINYNLFIFFSLLFLMQRSELITLDFEFDWLIAAANEIIFLWKFLIVPKSQNCVGKNPLQISHFQSQFTS